MNFWLYLGIPLIPTLFWAWYFYRTDRYEKEPKRLIFYAVILGALASFFAANIEAIALAVSGLKDYLTQFTAIGFVAFLLVGLVEEGTKLFALRFSFYRSKYFNEVADGIIYAVSIALGFAFVENILYSLQFGFEVSAVRALTTPIFHASAAAVAGYFLARSRFQGKHWAFFGLAIAVLIHSVSDFLLTGAVDNIFLLPIVIFIDLLFILWVLYLNRFASEQKVTRQEELKTTPGRTLLLSIIPGFGFIYLGKYLRGLFFMLAVISLVVLGRYFLLFLYAPDQALIFYLAAVVVWFLGAVLSYWEAKML